MVSGTLHEHLYGFLGWAVSDGEVSTSKLTKDVGYGCEHFSTVKESDGFLEIPEILHNVALIETVAVCRKRLSREVTFFHGCQNGLRSQNARVHGKVHTLEEVGAYFDVTRERIRQIEATALRKLRSPNVSYKLEDYVD